MIVDPDDNSQREDQRYSDFMKCRLDDCLQTSERYRLNGFPLKQQENRLDNRIPNRIVIIIENRIENRMDNSNSSRLRLH